jgi:hypothetical protein
MGDTPIPPAGDFSCTTFELIAGGRVRKIDLEGFEEENI